MGSYEKLLRPDSPRPLEGEEKLSGQFATAIAVDVGAGFEVIAAYGAIETRHLLVGNIHPARTVGLAKQVPPGCGERASRLLQILVGIAFVEATILLAMLAAGIGMGTQMDVLRSRRTLIVLG